MIKNGKYILQNTSCNEGIAAIGTSGWTDYTVTCKCTFLNGSAGNMGIIWRFFDGQFYCFGLQINVPTAGYCGFVNDSWLNGGNVIVPIPFNAEINKEYDMRLVVKRDSFQFFLDGKDMGVCENNQLKTGMVGVRTWSAIMALDNFEVNGPGIVGSAVESIGKTTTTWGNIKNSN